MPTLRLLWLGLRGLHRVVTWILGLAVAVIFFLGALAEVFNFVLDERKSNIVIQNIQNIASFIAPATEASPQCARYEKRSKDLNCDEKQNPAERMLCRVTVAPAQDVCVEYIKSAASARQGC